MVREIVKEEVCEKCNQIIKHSNYIYECDSCGKEMNMNHSDANNEDCYLCLDIFKQSGNNKENKIFCSWNCCINFLKSFSFTDDIWFINLPSLMNEKGEFYKFKDELKK